jgi:hypothetical protein
MYRPIASWPAFAASMSWSLIEFPRWRNRPWPFEDLVLLPQPLQFGRHVLLMIFRQMLDLALAAAVSPCAGSTGQSQELSAISLAPASDTRPDQPNGFILKLPRKFSVWLGYGDPLAS